MLKRIIRFSFNIWKTYEERFVLCLIDSVPKCLRRKMCVFWKKSIFGLGENKKEQKLYTYIMKYLTYNETGSVQIFRWTIFNYNDLCNCQIIFRGNSGAVPYPETSLIVVNRCSGATEISFRTWTNHFNEAPWHCFVKS